MLKQFLLLLCWLFLWSGLAQSEETDAPPVVDREADQKIIEQEMKKMQQESQNMALELQKAMGPEDMAALQKAMQEGDQAKIQELTKKLSTKLGEGNAGAGMDKMVELSLQSFRSKSPAELKTELSERITGTLFEPIVNAVPKLLDLVVNLFQDPVALPTLFTIPKDRKKLLIFLGVNIGLFIAAKVYKKMKKGEGAISRWLFFTVVRFGVLMAFFHKELLPTFSVFKRTFF